MPCSSASVVNFEYVIASWDDYDHPGLSKCDSKFEKNLFTGFHYIDSSNKSMARKASLAKFVFKGV